MPPFSHIHHSVSLSLVLCSLCHHCAYFHVFALICIDSYKDYCDFYTTPIFQWFYLPTTHSYQPQGCLTDVFLTRRKPLQVPLKGSSDDVPIPTLRTVFSADMDFSMILQICSFSQTSVCLTIFSFLCLSYFLFELFSTPCHLLSPPGGFYFHPFISQSFHYSF